ADYTQNVRPAGGLELGRAYPASTLIERMITESDNNAAIALGGGDADTWMARVFADLGLPRPRIDYPVGHYETSPRHFATFFRALFSASYLDQAHSDRALELLARTAFRRGLVAGVPADVRVAHKFGERTVGSQVELHDCGIVYCPERPYVLCVMTRGHDLDHLVSAVAEVSRATYQAVAADASHAPGH
ncbi:MAG TPA: serine hydrolase, partial [Polyangia bacterium]